MTDPSQSANRLAPCFTLILEGDIPQAQARLADVVADQAPVDGSTLAVWVAIAEGLITMVSGDYRTAQRTLQTAQKALPQAAGPALALALSLARAGRGAKADAVLAPISEQDPCPPEVLFMRALLTRYGEDEESVEALLRRTTDLDPENGEAWLELGRVLLETAQPEEAETAFQTAVTLAPENLDCLVGLAEALMDQDRFEDARALLEDPARQKRLPPHALLELARCRDEDGASDLALAANRAAISGDQALLPDAIRRLAQGMRQTPWTKPARLRMVIDQIMIDIAAA